MSKIAGVAGLMQNVLTTVADKAAKETGFALRRSKVTGARFAQTLVFGWLSNPDATLEELSQTALAAGLKVTPQGLDQRFGPAAAELMQKVLEAAASAAVEGESVALPLLRRFSGVYLLDSTTISLPGELKRLWPGCGGSTPDAGQATLKLHVRLELRGGSMDGPDLWPGRVHDKTAARSLRALPEDALRITDLGYFSLEQLDEVDRAGVYWLSRLHAQVTVFDQGKELDLQALAARQAEVDLPVYVGAQRRLPCRLIGVRVPEDVAAERRRRMHREARRERRTVSNRCLALAGWSLMLTNAPPHLLSLSEAQALYRARWQIEMLFKLWKSQGKIDQSRSQKPWRVMCEVYAKLVAMLIQHWVLITSCWQYPDRSLAKASATIRRSALFVAWSFASPRLLRKALDAVESLLAHGCRINKRRRSPATFQILQPFPQNALGATAVA